MPDTEGESFATVLTELRRGKTIDELGRQLKEVIAAVMHTGKKGQVQLTIDINPDKNMEESNQVYVTDKVKITLPQPDRASSTFFITEDFGLSRNDPRQLSMEGLKDVG